METNADGTPYLFQQHTVTDLARITVTAPAQGAMSEGSYFSTPAFDAQNSIERQLMDTLPGSDRWTALKQQQAMEGLFSNDPATRSQAQLAALSLRVDEQVREARNGISMSSVGPIDVQGELARQRVLGGVGLMLLAGDVAAFMAVGEAPIYEPAPYMRGYEPVSLSASLAGGAVEEAATQSGTSVVGQPVPNKIPGAPDAAFEGLGDATTSPWLADPRAGVRLHVESFRDGGSFLIPKSKWELFNEGKAVIGDGTGQFITTRDAMDNILLESDGNLALAKQKLSVPEDVWNEEILRVDIHNPLLHNARFPSGFERGANTQFRWGGYTLGGQPEVVLDQVPNVIMIDNIPKSGFTVVPTGLR
jgi:hypothetical protein